MALVIGTDEAGYGPSLGPLVITATAWDCPDRELDLYETLAEIVSASPKFANSGAGRQRLLIADSKVACRSGAIGGLEKTVLLLLETVYGQRPETLADLIAMVMPNASKDFLEKHFWLKGRVVDLPLASADFSGENNSELSSRFRAVCQQNAIRLTDIRSTILLPPEFNVGVIERGNKATLLSEQTLRLATELMEGRSDDTLIECDKHGGRSYYSELITGTLTDAPVAIIKESRQQSVYQWSLPNRECEVRFTAKGEGQLPVALASMVSKYVREVFMVAWNDYWSIHVPNIKPTKGYPQDAKRFLGEIKEVVAEKQLSCNEFLRSC